MNAISTAFAPLAHTTYKNAVLANADCMDALPLIPNNSVALVIIDPPYGAQTHNQQAWDVAWDVSTWESVVKHAFRILKSGGHLIVFASGKTIFDMHTNVAGAYKTNFGSMPSFYRMVWTHSSRDSGRVHSHTPRSQFEDIIVYYRTGEGKNMVSQGTLSKSYAFDEHVGRFNVMEFYKDDCRSKPFKAVQDYFAYHAAHGRHKSTFDYKPEALMRALIRDYSSPGNVVVDFCMRHGISAVASIMEARKFVGIEMDKTSFDYGSRRFAEQFMQEVAPVSVQATSPVSVQATAVVSPEVITEVPDTPLPAIGSPPRAAVVEAAQYASPSTGRTRKRQKTSDGDIQDSQYSIGTILEVGTPLKTTKLRILGMEMSLEKKGARYVVEYENGKKASMLILPKDIQDIIPVNSSHRHAIIPDSGVTMA